MSGTIKLFVLFIFLSIPLALANQMGENTNDSVFNFSVLVNDIRGNPINYAHIEVVSSSGSSIFRDTESNGRADIQITGISNLRVKAAGYRDWVNKEKISSNMLILTLENEYANTYFHITDTRNNNVPDAFIIVIDSTGDQIVNITDANGIASMHVSPGNANITIKADGYSDLYNNSIINSNNATYSYVIKNKNEWKILRDLIALMIPFLLTLYISLAKWPDKEKHLRMHAYAPFLGWGVSFVLLIYGAFSINDYNIYFFNPLLSVPLLVPIIAFIGVVSHITLSVLQNKERKIDDLEWTTRYEYYSRRIFIGPYIAIIAVFMILNANQRNDLMVVVFFAYFVGFYTKQIEGIFEELGKKILTEKLKNELDERDIKSLEIVRKLGVSTTIAGKLYKLGISEIDDIIAIQDTKIKEIALKVDIEEKYLTDLIKKTKKHVDDLAAMRKDLNIDRDTLNKLLNIGINSKHELAAIPEDKISDKAKTAGIIKENLTDLIEKAKNQIGDLETMGKDLKIDPEIISKLESVRILSKDGLKAIPEDKIKDIAKTAEIDEKSLTDLIEKAKTP